MITVEQVASTHIYKLYVCADGNVQAETIRWARSTKREGERWHIEWGEKKSGKHMNLEPIFYWHNIIGKVAVRKVGWKSKMHVIYAAAPTGKIYSRKNKLTSSRNFGNKKNLSASSALVNIFFYWSLASCLWVSRWVSVLPWAASFHALSSFSLAIKIMCKHFSLSLSLSLPFLFFLHTFCI